MGKSKEVELYEAFFPAVQGEGSSHATSHQVEDAVPTIPDEDVEEQINDAPGG
jgi:hypothetical protein